MRSLLAAHIGCVRILVAIRVLGLVLVLVLAPAMSSAGLFNPSDDAPEFKTLPACPDPHADAVCFAFQDHDTAGWESPDWFAGKERLVPCTVDLAPHPERAGDQVLSLHCTTPGIRWCAYGIGLQGPYDLSAFGELTAELFLPQEIPGHRVSVRLVFRAGKTWDWIPTRKATVLAPGQWVTLRVPLAGRLTDTSSSEAWGDKTAGLVLNQDLVQEILLRIEVVAGHDAAEITSTRAEVLVDNIKLEP